MANIKVVPLGAGQDVGRSCILLSIGGKNIMLDCGMHMGYNDDRRFPDFSYINPEGSLDDFLDCVIISHFHLDHCGALPHMSEMVGFTGPIIMTQPTKAICPILLEDYRKITVERKGETNFFTSEMIKQCMKKVIVANLHQTIQVDEDLEVKAYYAGHVLGAAMFQVKVGSQSIVYTGDYNMTPDRHLGAAWIDKCRPDLLITESTYATTIRDSKRCRERDFLKKVHDCVDRGGKVLIPVFALGRAQELCILLETYWDRMNLKTPIYFSLGLTEKANHYYKMFITWTNQKIKNTFVQRNMFDFKHITGYDQSFADNPGPMVVFSTPGMLHGGQSLKIFRKWCTDEKNMIIMPGYCVAGTVGWKILNGIRKIEFDNPKQTVDVKMAVQYMSFSAHADAKGIMQLIRQCGPKNVMLVHGEAEKMTFLKGKIQKEFSVDCYMPANGETVEIETRPTIPVDVSVKLLKRNIAAQLTQELSKKAKLMHGALVMQEGRLRLLDASSAMKELGMTEHTLRFTSTITLAYDGSQTKTAETIFQMIRSKVKDSVSLQHSSDGSISVSDSVLIKVSGDLDQAEKDVLVSWSLQDEDLGSYLLRMLQAGLPKIQNESPVKQT